MLRRFSFEGAVFRARPLSVLWAAIALFTAASLQAQVSVVESQPVGKANRVGQSAVVTGPPTAGGVQSIPSTNAAAETFYQMQVLQQEVLELRGLLEEQAFQIKKLKQQRTDDYLDLDRRISTLGGASQTPSSVSAATDEPASGNSGSTSVIDNTQAPTANTAVNGDESAAYRSAYNLLKARQVDQAVTAFSDLLIDYPEGQYAANAHYWLGEIFLLKNELESARQWFTRLLDGFPGHRKVPDAQFKLGKVYDLMGDKTRARSLLEAVAGSDANAARLAKRYLEEHFQ